ncbi:hypothetical protein AJ80_00962 [Polytolypa hystricis UAMH7299]|uniref:Uncharacterized protein n=1 Tax=Polytolypa hystricis (strain UAMH7299) TaxID=1447883 RepID=A0A2B7Z2F6_POLH7|nr:hypothetical protein AJ80_00962 [Polytolypa hystricis UAMH7299]
MISHRSTRLFGAVVFIVILFLILSSSPSPAALQSKGSSYAKYVPKPKLPKFDNFRFGFRPAAHKPAEQPNSSSGESKWYSDWKWMNPFSSSITLEENRSVLPPLRSRRPVYTYYDSTTTKQDGEVEADRQLLLAWRRAWFAQGFRPVVLGPSEAMNNPLYKTFHRDTLEPELHTDFLKWMAWGTMNSGIFVDWMCFPMAHYDDNILAYLRRGSDPTHITRLEGFDGALFSAERAQINKAIKVASQNEAVQKAKTIQELVPEETFLAERTKGMAHYNLATIKSRYRDVAVQIEEAPGEGKHALAKLINAHLQLTFHGTFSSGFEIIQPYLENTTAFANPALRLGALLAECAESPLPSSCPPNNGWCSPCKSGRPMKITQNTGYTNESATFAIGVLPHPYTLISLLKGSSDVTVPYIRRETGRDSWLLEATKPTLGGEVDGTARVVPFKDAVAGEYGASRTLWFTGEDLPAKDVKDSLSSSLIDDMEWHFGFLIPRKTQADEKETSDEKAKQNVLTPEQEKLQKEFGLIDEARTLLKSKKKEHKAIRDVAEAWNLADSEVWRFVRAYRARSVVERNEWQEKEKGYSGS